MDKAHLYNLGFAFRSTNIWKHIFEEELFAVKLPFGEHEVGYCTLMGRNGEHMALGVYVGTSGFSSYRKLINIDPDDGLIGPSDYLTQDCIQCSIEKRGQLEPEEAKEVKAYCAMTGKPFRGPFPQFTRFFPYCAPWKVESQKDWATIEAALAIVLKLAEAIKTRTKAQLGLRPILLDIDEELYAPTDMDSSDECLTEKVTIPLYSIVDDELVIERIPLPPYAEEALTSSVCLNEVAMANMMKRPQKGIYECEIIRLPEPVHGEPPFIPAALIAVDKQGLMLRPVISQGPSYDPNEMVNEFIANLGEAYPKLIQVRTSETETVLKPFCQRAKIRLSRLESLDLLDEAIDAMLDHIYPDELEDDEDDGFLDETDKLMFMLDDMPMEELCQMPVPVLRQLLEVAEYYSEDIAQKIRKAIKR